MVLDRRYDGLNITFRRRLEDTSRPVEPVEFREANWGTVEERSLAKAEFDGFVLSTWRQLVSMQKGHLNATPCTALFCRMDIGVMVREGRASYFVNEVERRDRKSTRLNSSHRR